MSRLLDHGRIAILTILVLAAACGPAAPTEPAGDELKIVTTTTILADLARNVAGEMASVESLLPPGADPHAFQTTPQDLVRISASDVLIVNGAGYEQSFESLLTGADGPPTTVIASEGLTPEVADGGANPHFWVNPQFVVNYVNNVRDGLIQADPDNAGTYTSNAAAYLRELENLDRWAEEQVLALPAERRLLVTNHDALAYFADRYGFDVVGVIIPSPSSGAGAAAGQMAAVIDAIKRTAAPAIFLDEVEDPSIAAQIALETGAALIDDLYFESLSAADGPAATYLQMIRHDVNRIVEALQP